MRIGLPSAFVTEDGNTFLPPMSKLRNPNGKVLSDEARPAAGKSASDNRGQRIWEIFFGIKIIHLVPFILNRVPELFVTFRKQG